MRFAWLGVASLFSGGLLGTPVLEAQAPNATIAPTVPSEAVAETDIDEPSPSLGRTTDATGYVLPQGTTELGIFYMGHGLTDWLSLGVQPMPWVIAPILGGVSANVSLKTGLPLGKHVSLALDVSPIWINIATEDTYTQGLILPVTLASSFHPTRGQSYSLAVRYSSANGVNDSSVESQEIAGSAITRLVQVIAQAQFQVSGAVAIYATGHLQPWDQNLGIHVEDQIDSQTVVEVEGETSASDQSLPWAALLGAHFRWGMVNLRVAVGYGNIFIPRLGQTTRLYQGVVPDLDFYVRF